MHGKPNLPKENNGRRAEHRSKYVVMAHVKINAISVFDWSSIFKTVGNERVKTHSKPPNNVLNFVLTLLNGRLKL
jgi:hypothetical protein